MRFGKIDKPQFLNVLMRLLPLAAKLALTLYMGRYFALADIGIYGLVFGTVIILNTLLGQGFNYVVARDIVHARPAEALRKMRDEALLNLTNYAALIVIAVILTTTGLISTRPEIVFFTVLLAALEGFAGAIHANLNSLNRQITANMLFFVRAGLWVAPVIVIGLTDPALRNVNLVLACWSLGAAASIAAAMWLWRDMPWAEIMRRPVDWKWLRKGVQKSSLIWLGTIGLNGGSYVDRFFVEHFLTLDQVGIITFYASFSSALLTLMQSGVLAFAYPRLITMHRDGHQKEFARETRQALWQVALGGGLVALTLAVIVPLLGVFTHREALTDNALTLWLMLFGAWLRSNAETFNYVLYARHQDRAIWLGNLLFLLPATLGNAVLVPLLGLPGIGWSATIAGAFLLLWRWRHVGKVGA